MPYGILSLPTIAVECRLTTYHRKPRGSYVVNTTAGYMEYIVFKCNVGQSFVPLTAADRVRRATCNEFGSFEWKTDLHCQGKRVAESFDHHSN